MKTNRTKPARAAVYSLTLPFLFLVAGNASAGCAAAGGTSADVSNVEVRQDAAMPETRVPDWQGDPDAYAPDGLSDYSADYSHPEPLVSHRETAAVGTAARGAGERK